jgi:hypothetical protein
MADVQRIDQVLQLAVLAAGRCDDFKDRQLSRIHMIKCAYFADLAYAQAHEGTTYTGAGWTFLHFGPWAQIVNERVEPAMTAIHAVAHSFDSRFSGEERRAWSKADDDLFHAVEHALPHHVSSAVKACVRKHGRVTETLLDETYKTPPMLRAVPGALLDFTPPHSTSAASIAPPPPTSTSAKHAKQTNQKLRSLKETVRARFAEKRGLRAQVRATQRPPRYDEVFHDGTKWLDELAGSEPPTGTVEVEFDESVWLSPTRGEERR